MPSATLKSRPPRRLFGPGGRLPIWSQWVISLGVAGLLVLALVLFVDHEQATANQPAPVVRPAAIAEQNREARVIMAQDQTPRTLRIAHPTAPSRAIRLAVDAVMRAELRTGIISGTLQRTACQALSGTGSARVAFSCTAEAADVNYLFQGVVDVRGRRVTVCKHDLAPVSGLNVPVSPRCR